LLPGCEGGGWFGTAVGHFCCGALALDEARVVVAAGRVELAREQERRHEAGRPRGAVAEAELVCPPHRQALLAAHVEVAEYERRAGQRERDDARQLPRRCPPHRFDGQEQEHPADEGRGDDPRGPPGPLSREGDSVSEPAFSSSDQVRSGQRRRDCACDAQGEPEDGLDCPVAVHERRAGEGTDQPKRTDDEHCDGQAAHPGEQFVVRRRSRHVYQVDRVGRRGCPVLGPRGARPGG
jgi:hypothetical protein